jgi:hypothetical protein
VPSRFSGRPASGPEPWKPREPRAPRPPRLSRCPRRCP